MDVFDLLSHGAPQKLVTALARTGIETLNPPQELCIKEGLLSTDEPFVVASPTASGKTLIAEMAVLKAFFEGRGKTVYLVPLRALAREKYEDFSKKYTDAGLKVARSTGDFDGAEPWLRDADLIICTNEKMDSLIRHRAAWLPDISVVVADEVHLLSDPHRGPTLEVVLTRLMEMKRGIRTIALSATIPNAGEIAKWIGARLVRSEWRPVPLREGVYFGGSITFKEGPANQTPKHTKSDPVNLALQTVAEGGQVLVFVNTRKSTEALARQMAEALGAVIAPKGQEGSPLLALLTELSAQVLSATAEPTRICKKLAEYTALGAAFHHAGINYAHRKLIEDAFRSNIIKVLVSTTTLAMGLNLPSRRVVIRDWWRYESGMGIQPVPAMEVKQMSGRAGRPGFDTYGEAVIVAKNPRDVNHLFKKYINGQPEPIESRLGEESILRGHVLATIASAFASSKKGLMDFFSGTFYAWQHGAVSLEALVDNILEFLLSEGLTATSKRSGLSATRFGRRVSELYIDPLSGVTLRDALTHPNEKAAFPLLHMIAATPDMMRLSVKKKDYDELLDIFYAHSKGLLMPEAGQEAAYPSDDMLSELKTASVLMQWTREMPEDKIVGHFGIGPGDLRTLTELAGWLIYSAGEISRVFNVKDTVKPLGELAVRVTYGVREELLELVSLRGVGRVRARNLFEAGFKTRLDLKAASAATLSEVPAVGKVLAQNIKDAL